MQSWIWWTTIMTKPGLSDDFDYGNKHCIMDVLIMMTIWKLWYIIDDFDDYDDFDFDYININKVEWFANILMRRTFAEGCNFKTFFTQDFCCNAKAYRIHALANLKCFRYFRKMPALCQNIKIWFQHVIHYFEEKKTTGCIKKMVLSNFSLKSIPVVGFYLFRGVLEPG